ncbi:MAG: MFS transporter, partial [Comamonadaceae bacterium]
RSLVPRMHVPAAARAPLLRVLPLSTAGWALGGFYLSLGPSLGRLVTGNASPLVGGLLIAALVLPGAVAIAVVRQRPPRSVLQGSAAALALGLAVTLAGVALGQPVAFFGGTLVAGLGFGAGFHAAVRCLVPMASAQDRAGLMASFFVLSYLAFSLPAIAAGLLTGLYGLRATALGYGLLLIVLACVAAFTARSIPDR